MLMVVLLQILKLVLLQELVFMPVVMLLPVLLLLFLQWELEKQLQKNI